MLECVPGVPYHQQDSPAILRNIRNTFWVSNIEIFRTSELSLRVVPRSEHINTARVAPIYKRETKGI